MAVRVSKPPFDVPLTAGAGMIPDVWQRYLLGLGTGLNDLLVATTDLTGVLQAAQFPALTGDVTTVAGALATTLATVNATVGTVGSSTAIPIITANAKGLVTALSTAVVIAPAGTLTGTTLAATVIASSLTSVGTLTAGATGAGFTVALTTSIITGTLADARLSANVALLNGNQSFTGNNTFTASVIISGTGSIGLSVLSSTSTGASSISIANDIGHGVSLISNGSTVGGGLADLSQLSFTNPLLFATSGTRRGTMFSSGGFAWGSTSDPGASNLDVAGHINIGTTGIANPLAVKSTGASTKAIVVLASGSAQSLVEIRESGASHAFIDLLDAANMNQIRLFTAGNSYFTGGNLGVGTNGPTRVLDVVGTAGISGITTLGAPVTLKSYTVATLPAGVQGHLAFATDLLAPGFLVAAVGGGAVVGPVFFNGGSWVAV